MHNVPVLGQLGLQHIAQYVIGSQNSADMFQASDSERIIEINNFRLLAEGLKYTKAALIALVWSYGDCVVCPEGGCLALLKEGLQNSATPAGRLQIIVLKCSMPWTIIPAERCWLHRRQVSAAGWRSAGPCSGSGTPAAFPCSQQSCPSPEACGNAVEHPSLLRQANISRC